jgi:hypothetical protein
MRLMKIVGTGALVLSTGTPAVAAHPPLDRPTPPPCCADGICRPNTLEWGVYPTRWRRWPTEELEPTPAGQAKPGQEIPGIPSYETMPPELEDRRAPPPTKPRAEPEERPEPPSESPLAPGPGGEPAAPRSTPLTSPPGGLLNTPQESPLTPGPTPFSPPTTPFSPGPSTPPTSPLVPPPSTNKMPWENGNEPTGDWDPPPALPSATAVSINRMPPPSAPNRFVPAQRIQPAARQRQAPSNDPPPTLPVSLASATY